MAVVESAEATEVVTPVRPRRSTRQQGRAWHGRACRRQVARHARNAGAALRWLERNLRAISRHLMPATHRATCAASVVAGMRSWRTSGCAGQGLRAAAGILLWWKCSVSSTIFHVASLRSLWVSFSVLVRTSDHEKDTQTDKIVHVRVQSTGGRRFSVLCNFIDRATSGHLSQHGHPNHQAVCVDRRSKSVCDAGCPPRLGGLGRDAALQH